MLKKNIKAGNTTIYTSEIKQCFILEPSSHKVKNFQISIFNEKNSEVYMGVSTVNLSENVDKIFYSSFLKNVFCEIPLNVKAESDSFIICFKSNSYNKIDIVIKEEFDEYVKSPNFVTDVISDKNYNYKNYYYVFFYIILILIVIFFILKKRHKNIFF